MKYLVKVPLPIKELENGEYTECTYEEFLSWAKENVLYCLVHKKPIGNTKTMP